MHVGRPPPDHAGGDANLCIAMSPKIDQIGVGSKPEEGCKEASDHRLVVTILHLFLPLRAVQAQHSPQT
jgi:hypothetical protein